MRRVMSGMDCGTSSGITNDFNDDGFERRTQENRMSKKEQPTCTRSRQTGASKHFGVLEEYLLWRIHLVSTIVYIQFIQVDGISNRRDGCLVLT